MKTEEIIDRLRHPQKYKKSSTPLEPGALEEIKVYSPKSYSTSKVFAFLITLGVLGMVLGVLLVTLHAKKRAENLSASLNPEQLKGLTVQEEFDPSKIVTYININQLGEGGDRVPTVEELGSTIPIISRYNYRAFTEKNYEVVGAAPWALSSNIEANIKDVDLLRYLLNQPKVATAFSARPDVEPLLEDPQLLGAFAQDNASLKEFFDSTLVQQVLANPDLVMAFGKSRLMSTLLVSKAAQYYRNHPQEAARLIHESPVLKPLTKNAGVRKAVAENYYLKSIASQLLDNKAAKSAKSYSRSAKPVMRNNEEAEG